MPEFENVECLTEKEHKFFSTIKYFFQAQSGYVCSNKERITEGKIRADHFELNFYLNCNQILNLNSF